jgi:hypothetical protein
MKQLLHTTTRNTHEAVSVAPEWIRLPRPGEVEPRTSLSRGVLSRLAVEGKVKTLTTKEPGKRRGCRLIHLGSLLSYLSSLAEGGEK